MTVVATIALAVAANGVVFAVLQAIVLKPLPYGDPGQLVTLAETDARTDSPDTATVATVEDLFQRSHSMSTVSFSGDTGLRLIENGHASTIRGMRVSANYFETLRVPMLIGRAFQAQEGAAGNSRVVILTYETWKEHFGADPAVIGRSVSTTDSGSYLVVGVLPSTFRPLHMANPAEFPALFTPLDDTFRADPCRAPSCRILHAIARLKPDVTVGQANAEFRTVMHGIVRDHPTDYAADASVVVTRLKDAIVGRFDRAAWTLEAAVLVLLLLACCNTALLLSARSLARRAELSVRTALGATRGRLFRQLFAEALILAASGGAAGTCLAWWVTTIVARESAVNVPRIAELHPDGAMVFVAIIMTGVSAITFGVTPALIGLGASRRLSIHPTTVIADRRAHRSLRILMGTELALTVVLVLAVSLLGNSYRRLMSVDLGFDTEHVTTVSLLPDGYRYPAAPQRLAYFDAIVRQVRTIPGVQNAGYASTLPLSNPAEMPLFVRERPIGDDTQAPRVTVYWVSDRYFDVMRIPLKRGRTFVSADSPDDDPVAVLSESAARRYLSEDGGLGDHLQLRQHDSARPWAAVVGIVGDVHHTGIDQPADPAVYLLFGQRIRPEQGWARLVVRSSLPEERIEAAVTDGMRAVDPLQPVFHLQSMDTYVSLAVSERRFLLALVSAFAALAITLAMSGVYAVVTYTVQQQTREIGLRRALGATAAAIQRAILKEQLGIATVSVVIGLVLAVALGHSIEPLLFGVSPTDPVAIVVAVTVIGALTAIAAAHPSWRAAAANPMDSLRAD